jgi:hypothetical protein
MLADVEALLQEAERTGSTDEHSELSFAEDLQPFLALVSRAREIGVEPTLAEKSKLAKNVPVDIRLLFLQAMEASERFGRDGGRSSLADARSACEQLLEYAAWAELPLALRLDYVGRLTDIAGQLYAGTGEVEFADQMVRTAAATEFVIAIVPET